MFSPQQEKSINQFILTFMFGCVISLIAVANRLPITKYIFIYDAQETKYQSRPTSIHV